MARPIMIQGTMSNAGKSLLCAGLCRIFRQDGYRVAPFKSQNMALNSYITKDGCEMGRAQVVQAQAAGIEPDVRMNPILLKPTTDVGSQVILNGKVLGNMSGSEYFRRKKEFIPDILAAYNSLSGENDIIVIEGAGSPAEINLKKDDIVNMGMAKLVDAPVFLAGDIDRGGVFAQLYGTVALLDDDEKSRIKGLIINKFRGDRSILAPGLKPLEEMCGIPVVGLIPYMNVHIDEEDSLAGDFKGSVEGISPKDKVPSSGTVDIAVIRLPKISNYNDLNPFRHIENVSFRYVRDPEELGSPDVIFIPGTKSTISDLLWMRENGLEASVKKASRSGTLVFGICGGYQILGEQLSDPDGVESGEKMNVQGMGLLPVDTEFRGDKIQIRSDGTLSGINGILAALNGLPYTGYEIHLGRSLGPAGTVVSSNNIYGTYVHGIFDKPGIADTFVKAVEEHKGIASGKTGTFDLEAFREKQYNIIAEAIRRNLDMDVIYRILGM